MAENDSWKVKIDPEEVGSTMDAFGIDGNTNVVPQRRVLHELIVQTVSERRFPLSDVKYEGGLGKVIKGAKDLPSYKALEQAGDYSPEKISAVLDEMGLERLPVHARAEQVMMVTGGPGTGKTSLVKDLAKSQPEIHRDAAQINPDHYKDLLADRLGLGIGHSEYTHAESSMIANKIMGRLDDKIRAGVPTPHVMLDVVSPNAKRMGFSKHFGKLTVVTGTAPPEVTMERAYSRAFDESGKVIGRVVQSEVVLEGAAKSSRLTPNIFDHPNLEFKLVNKDDLNLPDGKPPPVVAKWDNDTKVLTVEDPDTFMDFVERQDLNVLAENADELFEGVERSAETMAKNLKPYTDKGIQIDLKNPDGKVAISISQNKVDIHDALPSKRGAGFMADMAESFGKLGKNGSLVSGLVFGGLSAAFALAAGSSKAKAAEMAYEAAVPYGETQFDLARGDMEAAARSGTIETASNAGSAGGALAGAAVGTAIAPGIGTVVGGVAGALIGGVGTGYLTEVVYDNFASIKGSVLDISEGAVEHLSAAAQETKSFFGDAWDWMTGQGEPPLDMQSAYARLPDTATPDMPPEVASLVEVKASPQLFQEQFEALAGYDALSEVATYIENNPAEPEHKPSSSLQQDRTIGVGYYSALSLG